jgi:hypothetical protein
VTQLLGNVSGMALEFKGASRWAELSSPLRALKREYFLRYGVNFGWYGSTFPERIALFALLAYTLAAVSCLAVRSIRNHPGCSVLLLLGLFDYLMMALFDGLKNPWYLVHTLPLCAALLAICSHAAVAGARAAAVRRASFWAATAGMAVFSVVQAGSTVYSLRQSAPRSHQRAVVSFLRRQGVAPSRIIAPAQFAFDMGFDSGVIDDYRLGYFSGRRPKLIVASHPYQSFFERSAVFYPDIHKYVTNLLAHDYRIVFRSGTYLVYERN